MSTWNQAQPSWPKHEARTDAPGWVDHGSDFVLIPEGKPPSRIALAPSGCSYVASMSDSCKP
jgi:hypothetical protein